MFQWTNITDRAIKSEEKRERDYPMCTCTYHTLQFIPCDNLLDFIANNSEETCSALRLTYRFLSWTSKHEYTQLSRKRNAPNSSAQRTDTIQHRKKGRQVAWLLFCSVFCILRGRILYTSFTTYFCVFELWNNVSINCFRITHSFRILLPFPSGARRNTQKIYRAFIGKLLKLKFLPPTAKSWRRTFVRPIIYLYFRSFVRL